MAELDDSREAALAEIGRLVAVHGLSAEEILPALSGHEQVGESSGVLPRVMGYLGALFLFAGVAAFISLHWDSFGSAARVLVTLGVGVSVFAAAVMVERDGRWPIAESPLYLFGCVLIPTGMLVAFDEYGGGGDWRYAVAITSVTMTLQFGLFFLGRGGPGGGGNIHRAGNHAEKHGGNRAGDRGGNVVLLFSAILFAIAFWATVLDLAEVDQTLTSLAVSLSMILIGVGIDGRQYRWNAGTWTFLGSAVFYYTFWDLTVDEFFEFGFPLLTGVGVYVSVLTQTRSMLVTSVAALLTYTGYFTAEHFADSLGWPLVLMFIGVVFVGVGYGAVRFNRKYFQP